MCGIAGVVTASASFALGPALSAMADAIRHRGPDDEGFFEANVSDGKYRVGLAHRRLSIIDLSSGHQPMGNEDGSVQIVFNGEIYNFQELRRELAALGHQFATASDTEVIVHAYEQWGVRCLERLRGMFAFAIWDCRREELFLARDRFGKKPIFLAETGGTFVFGSEVGALLACPQVSSEIDESALWDYFNYRYVPGPKTLFKAIRKLPPGCYAIWRGGKLSEHRYYSPPDKLPLAQPASHDKPVEGFLAKLDEAVRIRMVADVPFGAFLSGGLDSSAIVALMARHSPYPVKTFSIGFAEGGFSELGHARRIAEKFNTAHTELEIHGADFTAHLAGLQRLRASPVAEPTDIPLYLLAREANKSVKMVLSGEGADEFLAGYPKHVFEQYAPTYQALPRRLREGLFAPLMAALPFSFHRAKTAVASLAMESFEERMPRWFGILSDDERSELLTTARPAMSSRQTQFDTPATNSTLRRILYFDQSSWLPDNMLERGDSMTMAASIETRMPFVDHELVEYVSRLPDDYRVRGLETKWILREAMKHILPAETLDRKKVGFRVPVSEWFRGSMREYIVDNLTGSSSLSQAYFQRPMLDRILDEHMRGRQNHEKLIWSMVSLETWLRAFRAEPGMSS